MLVKVLGSTVNLLFENDSGALVKKGTSEEIKEELTLKENISAPINKGDVLGKIDFYLNDELVSSVNLVAESEITKMTIFNLFEKTMNSWITLLR